MLTTLLTDEDDVAIAAEIAERNAAEDAAIAASVAARKQPETAEKAMARYMAHALDSARSFALDHAKRAEMRRLPDSERAFIATARAFDLLAETALSSGIRPSLCWCAIRAFRVACIATELERGGRYADARLHQTLECNDSEINEILWVVSNIADFHFMMTEEGSLEPHEAHIASAEAMMNLPSPPLPDEQGATQ